ncbi:unnamed protein product [Allacma fusca]|uniref:Uncharacterized protein n=1 Tax=Allacma fusca TaxID=39272 RepID=A0A8J2L8T5_9HEXA|nr:unnamed protein product [Allacma fusca]
MGTTPHPCVNPIGNGFGTRFKYGYILHNFKSFIGGSCNNPLGPLLWLGPIFGPTGSSYNGCETEVFFLGLISKPLCTYRPVMYQCSLISHSNDAHVI